MNKPEQCFDSVKALSPDEPFTSKRAAKVTRAQSKLAQADRLRVLTAEGYTVRVGPCGATVFRGDQWL